MALSLRNNSTKFQVQVSPLQKLQQSKFLTACANLWFWPLTFHLKNSPQVLCDKDSLHASFIDAQVRESCRTMDKLTDRQRAFLNKYITELFLTSFYPPPLSCRQSSSPALQTVHRGGSGSDIVPPWLPADHTHTPISTTATTHLHHHYSRVLYSQLEMWPNAQRDGHPAEYRWRPLFNATKFGWRPLLHCHTVVGRSSPYYQDMWRRYCCLTSLFSDYQYMP